VCACMYVWVLVYTCVCEREGESARVCMCEGMYVCGSLCMQAHIKLVSVCLRH
jgi:hypothetical protein